MMISGGGIIYKWTNLYKSESPGQVAALLLLNNIFYVHIAIKILIYFNMYITIPFIDIHGFKNVAIIILFPLF